MGLQLTVQYHNIPVTYDVAPQEADIFILKLNEEVTSTNGEEVPQKMVIRKKGKIWISDSENYPELVNALTEQINRLQEQKER